MNVGAEPDRSDPLLGEAPGQSELLLGNEAIVRGALEAGVGFACGYPGTPSSEITDGFARLARQRGIHFEYSVNEKIALEMAFAASLAGTRSIVAMKHLGLMAAGDPLSTIPYIGTVAGMVIVSAGDPSCLTSPNEQDQRYLAQMLHIPMLDPGTAQEALEMTRFAFEWSERSELPVILRPMTRLCHTRAAVRFGTLQPPQPGAFHRDPGRFVPIPANARRLRVRIDERLRIARELLAGSGFLRRRGTGRTAILAAGVPGAACVDVLAELGIADQVRLIQLGAVFPLAEDWLVDELRQVDRVLVVEELLPFVEDALRALCSRHHLAVEILGKGSGHFPDRFEYEPPTIRRGIHAALGLGSEPPAAAVGEPVPVRPPVLCAACPHRSAFFAARAAFGEDSLYFNDIGCYTLGFGEPLQTADALLCMGAGFSLAAGVSRTTGQRTVGFMGDSTFFHSGMPALLNAVKADADMVAVIMDNEVTAMTGFQESPTVEVDHGRIARRVDIEAVVRALGCEQVETVDPEDLAATTEAFRRARDRRGLAVVITRRACPVFYRRVAGGVQEPAGPAPPVYTVDQARCAHCGREASGQRCAQQPTERFQRAMARARALETGPAGCTVPETAPCASRCPLHLCVQGYAAHIAGGQYAAALQLIMQHLPLPESVCRVCHQPCEAVCVRGGIDEPVAINALKRFVVEWAGQQPEFPWQPDRESLHDHRVAVVGAGPAGLAAAYDLRSRGYAVTVYDAADEPGGLLLTGVPRYRLPLDALRRDVDRIRAAGVRFEVGRRLGTDIDLDGLLAEHDAVCLAIGAGRSRRLQWNGDGAAPAAPAGVRVDDALTYLRGNRAGEGCTGRHVVVVGGGNAAIDSARTALRGGAETVTLACLEERARMPAIRAEIHAAEAEGVVIETGSRIRGLHPGGVERVRVEPRRPDPVAPEDFVDVAGSADRWVADQVILAIGQHIDGRGVGAVAPDVEWVDGHLSVDRSTGGTAHPRLFAAGDIGGGPHTVTDAIAQGLRAAWGIDRAVRGAACADRRLPPPEPSPPPAGPGAARAGVRRHQLHPRQRSPERAQRPDIGDFQEVGGCLTEAQARTEAERCMICGQCGNCRSCLDLFGCPAILLDADLRVQIDAALCVGCGVCAQFCPNGAIVAVGAGGHG